MILSIGNRVRWLVRLKLLVVAQVRHSNNSNWILLLNFPHKLIDSASRCPPFICNSPSIACSSTIAFGLNQPLAHVAIKGSMHRPGPRTMLTGFLSLAVYTAAPGCWVQPGPHCSAPPSAWGWCSRQGQRVRLFFSLLSFVLLSISHDTNQSVLSGSGLVPLHNACSYGHYEVTELLLKVRHDFLFDELVLLGLWVGWNVIEQWISVTRFAL